MSYRELRDFCEHLRALGYPRSLTSSTFQSPNFPLIADLFSFLLRRFDPTIVHSEEIDSPQSRVAFIQNLTALAQVKCSTKLSMKSLYRADGFAVRELSKLSSVLYKAVIQSNRERSSDPKLAAIPRQLSSSPLINQTLTSAANVSLEEFKQARSLAPELIDLGERLSSALAREVELRHFREASLAFVDSLSVEPGIGGSNPVERTIRKQLELMADNVRELSTLTVSLNAETTKMSEKLSKRDAELDRMEKRFRALKRVRPAFADEYDNAEREVRSVYDTYVTALRNLRFLQSELATLRSEEKEQKDEQDRQMKRMQKKLKQEEMRILRGDAAQDDDDDDDDDEDDDEDDQSEQSDDDDENNMSDSEEHDSEEESKQFRGAQARSRFAKQQQQNEQSDDDEEDEDVLEDEDEEVSDSDGGFGSPTEESKYNPSHIRHSNTQPKIRPNIPQQQQLAEQESEEDSEDDLNHDDDDDEDQF